MKMSRLLVPFISLIVFAGLFIFIRYRIVTEPKPENIYLDNNYPTSVPKEPEQPGVPLPTQEDIIRTFFNLIDVDRVEDAVLMLTPENTADDSVKQSWGVQFNAFESVFVKSIEKTGSNLFKVTLLVQMKPGNENLPIPNYGFDNGENIRWVGLEKHGSLWRVTGIATGP